MGQKVVDIIKQIKENKVNMEFLPTGFIGLDDHLNGGFMRKELVVIGAYTGVGKSFFAGEIMANIARAGFLSAYFSLEISNAMIVSRLIGSHANIAPTRVMAGFLNAQEHEDRIRAEAKVEGLNDMMEFHDDLYGFEEIKKAIIDGGYEFVVVDFIQNVMAVERDEYARLSRIALEFQKLAKQTNACILLLSQLSNEAARRDSMEYKGSGSIATVCDLGFFIKRSEVSIGLDNQAILILRKNRRGTYGEFTFNFKQPGGLITEVL